MGREIERKFLVVGDAWRAAATRSDMLRQGYLGAGAGASIRVRTIGDREAAVTIKSVAPGRSRAEFEYPIPLADGRELLRLCGDLLLSKRRHIVPHEGNSWEVDEYLDRHLGLVIAELELENADQAFAMPPWLGREVTDDGRYFNASLARVGTAVVPD